MSQALCWHSSSGDNGYIVREIFKRAVERALRSNLPGVTDQRVPPA